MGNVMYLFKGFAFSTRSKWGEDDRTEEKATVLSSRGGEKR
jgi:hypothetical protein